MNILKNCLLNLMNLFHTIKGEHLKWQLTHQPNQAQLKQAQILAEKALEAELKKKNVQLEHEVNMLKTKQHTELAMYKIKCQQDIKDYKQYLKALDLLKSSIQASYTHLPEAVAFTIHHHAKFLLNKMWETEDFEQKMRYEMQLIQFMSTVHEDSRRYLEGQTAEMLPEKTLKLIHSITLNN